MPWGATEKHQSACERRQATKAHTVLCAHRQQWSIHSLLESFLTPLPGKCGPTTDYGVAELDLNWAHPLEMLSLGQGDLTVTLRHWWRTRVQVCHQLPGRIAQYGNVCWEDALKISEEQYHDWSRATSASLRTRLTGNRSEVWNPKLKIRRKSSGEPNSKKKAGHDRPEPFMGRGSRSMTTPPWSCKVTLWTLVLSLLLLSAMITTGSPTPVMGGQSKPEKESDSLGTTNRQSMDLATEENIDLTIKSTWTSTYENTTSKGHSEDELPANILFRVERSPEGSVKPKNAKRRGGHRENGKTGDGEKGCSKQKLRVQVRELGLGYDSDEWITFYYCSGSCQKTRTNYDLTLTALLKNKRITHSSHGRVINHPCCRPTSYLRVSFMDVKNNWHVVNTLSAANCSCVP